jgi:hypothetical protein
MDLLPLKKEPPRPCHLRLRDQEIDFRAGTTIFAFEHGSNGVIVSVGIP